MVDLFSLFIAYFGYIITPPANQIPTYNLQYGEKNSAAWVGVNSEAEGGDDWVKLCLCF